MSCTQVSIAVVMVAVVVIAAVVSGMGGLSEVIGNDLYMRERRKLLAMCIE